MEQIIGQYATALVYTDILDDSARSQLQTLCDQSFTAGCRIRIMPDVHAGTGCVIGFTADLGQRVIPSIVGVDIGCGMLTVGLGKTIPDLPRLDAIIRQYIPAGQSIHQTPAAEFEALEQLHCYRSLHNPERIECSIGTLGGGNHFIEVDVDDDGEYYLVIHTGSRNLGTQVAEHYQKMAYDTLFGSIRAAEHRAALIARYKAEGREQELSAALQALKSENQEITLPRNLCYLEGMGRELYLHDMAICQAYATLNRRVIADRILTNLTGKGLNSYPHFETIHNYIDIESNIIRKGAVSAKEGERLLIPINMRDGSLLCTGKGNPEWNYSAPHGAGRLFSRGAAMERFRVEDFRQEMAGIYTTSVSEATLDECPMAYKPMESIVRNVAPTVTIDKIIRPVYNFKAGN